MESNRLLPKTDLDYRGPKVAFYFLILINLSGTARSLIHLLAPDGGAGSIAGIAVTGPDGQNIVAMFGQWGASQMILATILWVIILRYRFLTPLALGLIMFEQVLRIAAGQMKPLVVAAPPPGAIGSELILPLAMIALVISLWGRRSS